MKFHLKILVLGILTSVVITSCTVVSYQEKQETQKTQLQTREFQTRTFDTNNVKLVMKAALNVLQDDGFVVKNAVVDLGQFYATKEIDIAKSQQNSKDDVWGEIFAGILAGKKGNRDNRQDNRTYQKIKIIDVNVTVSEYGKQCKVRATFQAKILDNTGNTVEVYPVEDMKFYQDFFAKMDKGIFIEKQGL